LSLDRQTLLFNARVLTMDPVGPRADSLLLAGDRILFVGDYHEAVGLAGLGCRRIDLDGCTVVPGFIDGHCHFLSFALGLERLDLSSCRSLSQMKEAVREAAASSPPGSWILGGGWDQDRMIERRYPRREDLDEVSPHHPVMLYRTCFHAAVANSRALEEAGITSETPDPSDGRLDRDDSGRPTGMLRESAMRLVSRAIPEPDRSHCREALLLGIERAHSYGLTSVQSNDGWGKEAHALLDLYREVCGEDRPFRVYLDLPYAMLGSLRDIGLLSGSGNHWVRVGGIKLFTDGSLGASTAALTADYADQPGNRGILMYPPEELDQLVEEVHRAGMQLALHAIGDLAVDLTLDALTRAHTRCPRPDSRHRVIHCQVMRPEQFSRMHNLNAIAAIQPKFVTSDMFWAEDRLGPERVRWSYACRSFLTAGVASSGGSDAPVEPIQPLWGVFAAVERQDMECRPAGGWLAPQRVSFEEAISLYTRGSALAEFTEKEKGVLRRGALGDFVVLPPGADRFRGRDLRDMQVISTWVGGRPVYGQL